MIKKLLVFYFHGYGSNPASDKVERLKQSFENVYAFRIDIDPSLSLPFLEEEIDNVLLDHMNNCKMKVVFVGTSLGAWYASELGARYGIHTVCINPAFDPATSLRKYLVAQDICDRYTKMEFSKFNKYFIGTEDEVIDYTPVMDQLEECGATFVPANHRFNGPEFDLVIDHIKARYK